MKITTKTKTFKHTLPDEQVVRVEVGYQYYRAPAGSLAQYGKPSCRTCHGLGEYGHKNTKSPCKCVHRRFLVSLPIRALLAFLIPGATEDELSWRHRVCDSRYGLKDYGTERLRDRPK